MGVQGCVRRQAGVQEAHNRGVPVLRHSCHRGANVLMQRGGEDRERGREGLGPRPPAGTAEPVWSGQGALRSAGRGRGRWGGGEGGVPVECRSGYRCAGNAEAAPEPAAELRGQDVLPKPRGPPSTAPEEMGPRSYSQPRPGALSQATGGRGGRRDTEQAVGRGCQRGPGSSPGKKGRLLEEATIVGTGGIWRRHMSLQVMS